MSAFDPMSLNGQPDQKRALLEQLMQQYQDAASRAAAVGQAQGAAASIGAGAPFRAQHPFGGVGLYTGVAHALPAALAARLGPGAIGTAHAGQHSTTLGAGVTGGHPIAAHGNPMVVAAGPAHVIAAHAASAPAIPGVTSAPTAVGSPSVSPNVAVLGAHQAAVNQIVQRRQAAVNGVGIHPGMLAM